jgi:hypothetical protein
MARFCDWSAESTDAVVAAPRRAGAIACVALALLATAPGFVQPSTAEEATTAPTCTGCSRAPAVKRQAKPQRAAARPARREPARAAVNNDGAWSGVSSGPCIPNWKWTLGIGGGAITGHNVSGSVTRTGATRGAMVVFGKTYNFVGHFNGGTGAGTWKSVECSGSWTATKS